jgi:hypothetical protein
VEGFSGVQRKGPAYGQTLAVRGQIKRRTENNAREIAVGAENRPRECDLQGCRHRWVANQPVAQGKRIAIRRAADGDAKTSAMWPAAINDERVQPGVEDVQAHEKARMATP